MFIQPTSEQHCLIRIPFLGITVRRANGQLVLHAAYCSSVIILGQKGRVVEAHVDGDTCCGSEFLFQPEHKVLEELGVWTQESLI